MNTLECHFYIVVYIASIFDGNINLDTRMNVLNRNSDKILEF